MKYRILLIIFIICLFSSVILTMKGNGGLCKPGDGCDIVQSSSYAYTLGVKNPFYGVGIFGFMIFLTIFHINKPTKHTRNLIHLAMFIGSVIALYFLYLQVFVLKAYCPFCLVVDIGLLIGLVFMFYLWKH